MRILCLNCGSSSAKFAVIDAASGREAISGLTQRLGTPQASLDWKIEGKKDSKALAGADHNVALRAVVELLKQVGLVEIPVLVPAGQRVAVEFGYSYNNRTGGGLKSPYVEGGSTQPATQTTK